MSVESAPIEGVERTNTVIVCPSQRAEFTQYNPYAMAIDRRNRNCYNCGGFGHLARNYRNKGTENRSRERRRLEYEQDNGQRLRIEGENRQNNLNRQQDLIVFN